MFTCGFESPFPHIAVVAEFRCRIIPFENNGDENRLLVSVTLSVVFVQVTVCTQMQASKTIFAIFMSLMCFIALIRFFKEVMSDN